MTETSISLSATNLHSATIEWVGAPHDETDSFGRDLLQVWNSVHQGMVVYGPWMEARISHMVRSWLPRGWWTSGPSQIYRPDRPELRSRSWDIVVHRYPLTDAGPEAAPGGGYALLPASQVCAVIDTKTHFSDPPSYGKAVTYNLMNDCPEPQVGFLGEAIAKLLLVVTSSRSLEWMRQAGVETGLSVFTLGRYRASPVSDAEMRKLSWEFQAFQDGSYPLDEFKRAILEAISNYRETA